MMRRRRGHTIHWLNPEDFNYKRLKSGEILMTVPDHLWV